MPLASSALPAIGHEHFFGRFWRVCSRGVRAARRAAAGASATVHPPAGGWKVNIYSYSAWTTRTVHWSYDDCRAILLVVYQVYTVVWAVPMAQILRVLGVWAQYWRSKYSEYLGVLKSIGGLKYSECLEHEQYRWPKYCEYWECEQYICSSISSARSTNIWNTWSTPSI